MAKRAKQAADTPSEPVEGPWELPEGWRWQRLDELADIVRGVTYAKPDVRSEGTGVPLLRGNNIQDGRIDLSGLIYIDTERVAAPQFVQPGDVVMTTSSGSIALVGKTAWVGQLPTGTTFGAFCAVIRSTSVVGKWLFWATQSDWYRRHISDLAKGTNINNLKRDHIGSFVMPMPPLETQQRIVARIDELFTELDVADAALAQARADLGVWRKALLKAAVTGELTADWRAANPPTETGADLLSRILTDRRTRWAADPKNKGKRYVEPVGPDTSELPELPEGWVWATLPQLGDFGRGKSKHRPRNDPKLYGGTYPFVQTGEVANCAGKVRTYRQTYSDVGLSQSKLWPSGTLCITIAANIAKTGVLTFDACFPDSLVGLSPVEGVRPDYIELVIRSLQAGLEADAPATAQRNINLEILECLPIPLPPSTDQIEIVRQFDEGEDAMELLLRPRFADDPATLRQSILAAAFRGDLVQ